MSRALNEIIIKFTSDHQSLVDAYAQHQLSTKKHQWTTWRWVSHFAYVTHILRRNSACSRLRITWAIACWWACHKLISHVLMHMLSICRRIFARLAIHDIRTMRDLWLCCFLDASLKLCICTASILRSCCLSSSYFNYITSILELMISICRKLSRDWNNFELMISICRKLSRGRNQKKKFRPWLNFSNLSPTVTPNLFVISLNALWHMLRIELEAFSIRRQILNVRGICHF